MRFDEGIDTGMSGDEKQTIYPDSDMFCQSNSAPNTPATYRRKSRVCSLLEEERRRNSLPTTPSNSLEDYCDGNLSHRKKPLRIRSFRITSKGVPTPSKGDRRESNASVLSISDYNRSRMCSETSDDSAIYCPSSTSSVGYYRVSIMGADAVGKRTLTNQFMCSDRMSSNIFEIGDLDDNMVTVVIDNEESLLEFVDSQEDDDNKYHIDAYIVVFSVHERPTFDIATHYVHSIRNERCSDRPIILVANKVDLVRKRQISQEEAKRIATKYNCKYIETSATLNVKVDDLLVGIMKQIKLKLNPEMDRIKDSVHKGPFEILSRIFHLKPKVKSKHEDVLI